MRKCLTVISIFAIFISGCSTNGGYKVDIHKEEQETSYSTVYAEVLEFDKMPNKEYQSELNMSLREEAADAIGGFDLIAQEAQDTLPAGVKSSLYITQRIKRNSGGILSFITENYMYTGGAHGMTSWKPQTINTLEDKPHNLEPGELFSTEDYTETINKIIEKMVKDNPDKYSELWAKPKITEENKDRFYLTDSEFVVYFPPYELSYYAKGFIDFPIPFTELNPILNEPYRQKDN